MVTEIINNSLISKVSNIKFSNMISASGHGAIWYSMSNIFSAFDCVFSCLTSELRESMSPQLHFMLSLISARMCLGGNLA
jgi:hypothetical protein